jgi:hypothetical protein
MLCQATRVSTFLAVSLVLLLFSVLIHVMTRMIIYVSLLFMYSSISICSITSCFGLAPTYTTSLRNWVTWISMKILLGSNATGMVLAWITTALILRIWFQVAPGRPANQAYLPPYRLRWFNVLLSIEMMVERVKCYIIWSRWLVIWMHN